MKLFKFGKVSLLLIIYIIVVIWIGTKIWGSPKSTFEKMIHCVTEKYEERIDRENIRYSVETEYITTSGHMLFQITGFEAEIIDGLAEFTLDSIILEKEDKLYSVDIVQEKLEHAARYAECDIKSDKIAYKAIIPTDILESGKYKIGLLLEDNTMIWTSEYLTAHPCHMLYYDDNDKFVDNELNIISDTLWYNRSFDCLEGIGTSGETEIEIVNNAGAKYVKLLFHIKVEQENTYFVFCCNDVTLVQDIHQGEEIELCFPLIDGKNIIYIYYLSEDEQSNTEELKYYIDNIDIEYMY